MPVMLRIALALLLVGKISASAQFASEQAVALDCALPSTVPAASSSQVYKPNASRKTSEDNMTITVDKDGSWHWDGGKDGAQEFDEKAKAMTEALKRYDELGEHCYAQRNPAIGEDTRASVAPGRPAEVAPQDVPLGGGEAELQVQRPDCACRHDVEGDQGECERPGGR